jgi:hypothetical protein
MALPGYPKRAARCKHGDHVLSKAAPDAPWRDAFDNPECQDAPNPEDGPMPGHEPGSPVLSPPVFDEVTEARTDLPPVSMPFIPR